MYKNSQLNIKPVIIIFFKNIYEAIHCEVQQMAKIIGILKEL
jgi:hypothetical protein